MLNTTPQAAAAAPTVITASHKCVPPKEKDI